MVFLQDLLCPNQCEQYFKTWFSHNTKSMFVGKMLDTVPETGDTMFPFAGSTANPSPIIFEQILDLLLVPKQQLDRLLLSKLPQ